MKYSCNLCKDKLKRRKGMDGGKEENKKQFGNSNTCNLASLD